MPVDSDENFYLPRRALPHFETIESPKPGGILSQFTKLYLPSIKVNLYQTRFHQHHLIIHTRLSLIMEKQLSRSLSLSCKKRAQPLFLNDTNFKIEPMNTTEYNTSQLEPTRQGSCCILAFLFWCVKKRFETCFSVTRLYHFDHKISVNCLIFNLYIYNVTNIFKDAFYSFLGCCLISPTVAL